MNSLFDYSVRVSRKVKQAKLRIKPLGRLEVVIPLNFPRREIPGLLHKHADWIGRHLKTRTFTQPDLPNEIRLNFDGSQQAVIYDCKLSASGEAQILITGERYQDKIAQLRHWIRQQAWFHLPPLLEQLSRQTGLGYKKISIRSQKTRWGSCSSSGAISVNDQLLFLPRNTAAYLMVHELCHTQHMNHSQKFWRLVEQHCPDFRDHECILHQAKSNIPGWFLSDLHR